MDALHRPAQPWVWQAELDPAEHAQRIAAHPRFPHAARALAAHMLTASDTDPALAAVFRDAGRYATAMWTVFLHATDTMTLPHLKEACTASGLASSGRARLLLQVLEHIGYVAPMAPAGDGKARHYALTPAFLAAWRGHLHAALSAAALVDPAIKALADRLDEPAVFERLLRLQAARLPTLTRWAAEMPAFQRILMHRYAGLLILSMLVVEENDGAFPPAGPIPIALKPTAARFGVSYMHVRRLLHDAAEADLLDYEATGSVTLRDAMRRTIRLFYAAQLAELVASARLALATLEPLRRDARISAP